MPAPEFLLALDQAASRSSPRRRDTLRDVTDLFVGQAEQYTEEQVELFDLVLSRLIVAIETAALAELAGRLAVVPNAPRGVIRTLAFADDIAVAGPVLTHSERLDEKDLVANARQKSQDHLLAMAQRKVLPEALTDILLDRGNAIVVRSTAGNGGARFSAPGYDKLIRHAAADDQLALVVAARPELPRHLFLRLVAKASDTVRARLQALNPQAAGEIKAVVAEVASRVRQKIDPPQVSAATQTVIDTLRADEGLDERRVAAFAQAGQRDEVTAALAALSGLPVVAVEQAMAHDRAETVLIITKAIGFSWPTVKAILIVRAPDREVTAYELDHCLASFDRLKRDTAMQILKFHQAKADAGRQPS